MGYRTVVMLQNDLADKWIDDTALGHRIYRDSMSNTDRSRGFSIVECTHNDVNTLVEITASGSNILASNNWRSGQTDQDRQLDLLKRFADSMGYTIRRKSK